MDVGLSELIYAIVVSVIIVAVSFRQSIGFDA